MTVLKKAYKVPEVFVRPGFDGFKLVRNQNLLIDENENPVEPEDYAHTTIINGRTQNADKDLSPDKMESLVEYAEEVLKKGCWEQVALIGGMPVLLRTNSYHAINFWRWNWYLGDMEEVRGLCKTFNLPLVEMRCVLEEGVRDPAKSAAYYCKSLNRTVFINTDYYGQLKSWALGAAGVELALHGVHSIHGAVVEIDGHGILVVAPTGTGKSTYINILSRIGRLDPSRTSRINSDDWVYVKDGVASPSERFIYVRTNAVADDVSPERMNPTMKMMYELFEKSPCENVVMKNGSRLYSAVPNSRAMIDPEEISETTYSTPIDLIVLLRRDSRNPFELDLGPEEATTILREGLYTVQPGSGPKEKWGQLSNEPWYNPYLLRVNADFEARSFASYITEHKARCIIYNTHGDVNAEHYGCPRRGGELRREDYESFIDSTARLILQRLDEKIAST